MLLVLAALATPAISVDDRARIERREVVVHHEIRESGASVRAFVPQPLIRYEISDRLRLATVNAASDLPPLPWPASLAAPCPG